MRKASWLNAAILQSSRPGVEVRLSSTNEGCPANAAMIRHDAMSSLVKSYLALIPGLPPE